MSSPYFERFLLVVGDQDTGKSAQLRSMFLDPRINYHRSEPIGSIPAAAHIQETYPLSYERSLYLRLTSPHEAGESLEEFLEKITNKTRASSKRWCVATALQINSENRMPDLQTTVRGILRRFSPERIRVCILCPDRHGCSIEEPILLQLTRDLQRIDTCEVIMIDARNKRANGLLLADFFDFT